jgi:2'-5' RNA ligase
MMKLDKVKRLFIAVEITPSVVKEVKRIQQFLKKEEVFHGRYVDADKAHITLKFLGDIEESKIPIIQKRLRTIKHQPMKAHLGKLDLFKSTNTNEVRVIFLSIVCPELAEIAKKIDETLTGLINHETRAFTSHLTIARVREIADYDILGDILDQLKVEPITFDINSFVLKQSKLSSDGPIYKDIECYKLA